MSELRDRLEALATRGTRRGADDVLNAARRDAETDGAEHASDTDDDVLRCRRESGRTGHRY